LKYAIFEIQDGDNSYCHVGKGQTHISDERCFINKRTTSVFRQWISSTTVLWQTEAYTVTICMLSFSLMTPLCVFSDSSLTQHSSKPLYCVHCTVAYSHSSITVNQTQMHGPPLDRRMTRK